MSPPPMPLGVRQPTLHRTAVRTARVRRDLLAQCDTCGAIGTARSIDGRVAHVNLATTDGRHADCGGRLVTYDIEVGA